MGVASSFFPLVHELHYEFAALSAVAASLVSGITLLYAPARYRLESMPVDGKRSGILWQLTYTIIALSFLPLLIAIVRLPFLHSCGIHEGLLWYLLLVPASAFISCVLAYIVQYTAWKRWLQLIAYLLLWSGSALRGAYEAWTGPHIFLYAWQIGYFPGGSYDPEMPITSLLILYHAAQVIIALALLVILIELKGYKKKPSAHRTNLIIAGTTLAVAVLACLPYRSELGLTRTDTWLREQLGDSLHTQYATLYYEPSTTDSLDLWRAATLVDFYIEEEAEMLGLGTEQIEPVTLYLFSSAARQKELIGTSSVSFTKPWRRTVNLTFDRITGSLKHELAHIMLEPYGNVLGITFDQGLLEGSAMAIENEYGWLSLHEYARAMDYFGLAPPASELMSPTGFSSNRSSLSYVLSGSFSQWLIETYGIERYLRVFSGVGFAESYGQSLEKLSDEYQEFISEFPAPDSSLYASTLYRFGGGSFFFQQCLRRIGTLNARGYEALFREQYQESLEYFQQSLKSGITYGARAGILQGFKGEGRYRELLDSAMSYSKDTASYPLLPMLIEQGDAYWALGDTASATALYDSVLTLGIDRWTSTRAASRLYFMHHSDSLLKEMRTYFLEPMTQIHRMAFLSDIMGNVKDTTTRTILEMMYASLISSELPVTAHTSMSIDLANVSNLFPPIHDSTWRYQVIEQFVASSLVSSLLDSWLYSNALSERGIKNVSTDKTNTLLDFIYQSKYPGIRAGSPTWYNERRTEVGRYIKYLHDHSILP